ncbi:hypothetical protein F2P81_020797 [Scophthalmus maximus]|uniref:Uncharacterized protein n=1 Tax=Scophthalmus maximus TaxID=52904 RepID=A0A6A4S322_SCOMX|nr:hypothetical protein F2P81_020797 [Scophthalmus maximus]
MLQHIHHEHITDNRLEVEGPCAESFCAAGARGYLRGCDVTPDMERNVKSERCCQTHGVRELLSSQRFFRQRLATVCLDLSCRAASHKDAVQTPYDARTRSTHEPGLLFNHLDNEAQRATLETL